MMWQHNNIAWQKKKGMSYFRTAHWPLARHGAGIFAL